MSSIADALKRAQQERDRRQGRPPDARDPPPPASASALASVILRRTTSKPAAPSAPPIPAVPAAPVAPLAPAVQTLAPAVQTIAPPVQTLEAETKNVAAPAVAVAPPVAPAVATPATHNAEPKIENPQLPLATALRQAPAEPPARERGRRAAETIVEDYASKRKLNLPHAIAVYHDRAGPVADQFRELRDRLAATRDRALVLTSSQASEGKTTTLLNLGLALVELRNQRVVLIDACTHTPRPVFSLTNLLHQQSQRGLAELLATAPDTFDNFLKATPWHNLFLLPRGACTAPSAAAELLQSPALHTTLRHLRSTFDWVLIDAPDATFPDAALLATHADALLLAAALHRTPHAAIQSTLRRLKSLNQPPKSLILTRA